MRRHPKRLTTPKVNRRNFHRKRQYQTRANKKLQGSPVLESVPIFDRTNFLLWDGIHYKFERVKHRDGSNKTEIINECIDKVEPHVFLDDKLEKVKYRSLHRRVCIERCLISLGFC